MSAFIGYCFEDGVFLSADSRRTHYDDKGNTNTTKVQKIHKLNENMLIATGGLGSVGHSARKELEKRVQGKEMNSDEIIKVAGEVFKKAYDDFLKNSPNNEIPLTFIIAGVENDKGFIKVISSDDNFKVPLSFKPGFSYFTGSNTALVQSKAVNTFYDLQKKHNKFLLDKWAFDSFSNIVTEDATVGFPVQMNIIKKDGSSKEIFIPHEKSTFIQNKDFIL